MTPWKYEKLATMDSSKRDRFDGRQTDPILKRLFAAPTGALHGEIDQAVRKFIGVFDKQPNSKFKILVHKDAASVRPDEQALAQAFLTIFRSLPDSTRQDVRRMLRDMA